MRLGVQAALVGGELLPGRRRGRRRPDRGRRPRLARRPRDRRSRLRRPAGERIRRRRLPRGGRRRATARRRRAARDRRHRLPADADHLLRGAPRRGPRARCRSRRRARGSSASTRGPVPLAASAPARIRWSSLRDPDPALLERLLEAGPGRLITLAPELPGAYDLIELLHARAVVVSCGHTDATREEANAAFDRGVHTVTHLFNAMRPFQHRDPGIAGAALARDDVVVQIIVDGIHLAPDTVRLVWEAAGRPRRARHRRGRRPPARADGAVQPRRRSRGRRPRRRGPPRPTACSPGSVADDDRGRAQPARARRAAGARARGGQPRPGRRARSVRLRPDRAWARRADLVVLDDDLEIERVLVGGETLVAV